MSDFMMADSLAVEPWSFGTSWWREMAALGSVSTTVGGVVGELFFSMTLDSCDGAECRKSLWVIEEKIATMSGSADKPKVTNAGIMNRKCSKAVE
jgi:hypothetical protein